MASFSRVACQPIQKTTRLVAAMRRRFLSEPAPGHPQAVFFADSGPQSWWSWVIADSVYAFDKLWIRL
jgi:hypothetical protein